MIKKDDIFDIKINSMVYGEEGIGKIDDFAVFVANSAPEDILKVKADVIKKNYAKAQIQEIIKPSPSRVEPICGLSKICGGCQWQHIKYEEQLKAKIQNLKDCLKKIANVEIPIKDILQGEKQTEYRCKVQYPIGQTKVSKRFLAGYYKKGTHEIINIKKCPVQPEIIDKIIEFFREEAQKLNLTAYNEQNKKGLIRHLVFRYSYSKKNLILTIVINDKKTTEDLEILCNNLFNDFDEIAGMLVNFNTKNSNVIMGNQTELICGQDFIEEELNGKKFHISAGSFFQVNIPVAIKMFDEVKNIIFEKYKNPTILDCYSGVGSFSIWLSDIASKIVAVEEYPKAVEDAKINIELNKIKNMELIQGDAKIQLENLVSQNQQYDVVVIDPPRKGCENEIIEAICTLSKNAIVYISCNPSTLARDIKLFQEKGFSPQFARPVDMFCHTYHLESIVLLEKN
ncbi:MAG: 23S rRNA (uracil(1939)-C(5))-methyltransferase RlmD [Candidatus Gastranaerophilales bacterium]|nr:23S rRNA (uracil(1939)-C(5))-methyltransferase RlmD [Candidatus Gastranaerophilales bacterium]